MGVHLQRHSSLFHDRYSTALDPESERAAMDDEHDLLTPEEIADVTGGDVERIRDGMRAFEWVGDNNDPSVSENIGSDCRGCVDNWPPLRDYRRQDWHFEQAQGEEDEAGREG